MKALFLLLLIFPMVLMGHPGIGIVKDSNGNIYYTDLHQVWKISQGKQTVLLPNVHTHELYIDKHDNLYGESESYEEKNGRFIHYLWKVRPNGRIDTVITPRESYVDDDYSLARDLAGNEFYIKKFHKRQDPERIYKRTPDGKERVFAKGNFRGVRWLHPQKDGSLLYVNYNSVFRISPTGQVHEVVRGIGNEKPTFAFSRDNITVWGTWQDASKNIYVAVFSDQTVRKISPDGKVTDFYRSQGNWAPTHGVFDDKGQLWVLECSDKNEIRAIQVTSEQADGRANKMAGPILGVIILISGVCVMMLYRLKYDLNSK